MVKILFAVVVVAVAFIVVSVVDCAVQPRSRHRGVPKPAWIVIILVLPVVGALLWFFIGRGPAPRPDAVRSPDDDLSFLDGIDLTGFNVDGSPADAAAARAAHEERIRRLEAEIERLDAEERDQRGDDATGRA